MWSKRQLFSINKSWSDRTTVQFILTHYASEVRLATDANWPTVEEACNNTTDVWKRTVKLIENRYQSWMRRRQHSDLWNIAIQWKAHTNLPAISVAVTQTNEKPTFTVNWWLQQTTVKYTKGRIIATLAEQWVESTDMQRYQCHAAQMANAKANKCKLR